MSAVAQCHTANLPHRDCNVSSSEGYLAGSTPGSAYSTRNQRAGRHTSIARRKKEDGNVGVVDLPTRFVAMEKSWNA
jgi:hypothetical protein